MDFLEVNDHPDRCRTPTPDTPFPDAIDELPSGKRTPTQTSFTPLSAPALTTKLQSNVTSVVSSCEKISQVQEEPLRQVSSATNSATEADYIFLSAKSLRSTDEVPPSQRYKYFMITSEDKEDGHDFFISYRVDDLTEVLHQNVNPHAIKAYLKKWLALSHIKSFSVSHNLVHWQPKFLANVVSVICEHTDAINKADLHASDPTGAQCITATDLTSVKSNDISNTPNIITKTVYARSNFANFCSINFTQQITEVGCIALLGLCRRVEHMSFQNAVQGNSHQASLESPLSPKTVVELPRLKTLRIFANFDSTTMLDRYACPAMTGLHITIAPTTNESIFRLSNFLTRRVSDEPLLVLNIFDYSMESDVAIPLLSAMGKCRWGPEFKRIETLGVYTSSLPKTLVDGFSAAWHAHKNGNVKLLNTLFEEHRKLVRGSICHRLARVGWGIKPFLYDNALL